MKTKAVLSLLLLTSTLAHAIQVDQTPGDIIGKISRYLSRDEIHAWASVPIWGKVIKRSRMAILREREEEEGFVSLEDFRENFSTSYSAHVSIFIHSKQELEQFLSLPEVKSDIVGLRLARATGTSARDLTPDVWEKLIHLEKLKSLVIHDFDCFENYGDVLPQLGRLRLLELSGNSFGAGYFLKLASVLRRMEHLEHLAVDRIGENGISESSRRVIAMKPFWDALPNLISLRVAGRVRETDSQAVAEFIKRSTRLETLGLDLSSFLGKARAEFFAGLKTRTSLKGLTLDLSSWGEDGFDDLAAAIRELRGLRGLEVSGDSSTRKKGEAFSAALGQLGMLEALGLHGFGWTDDGYESLGASLEKLKRLVFLDLEKVHLGAEGYRALSRGLQEMSQLEYLGLAETNLDLAGSRFLALGLEKATRVKYLSAASNEMGPEAGRILGEALGKGSNWVTINLVRNKLGNDGMISIMNGLRSSSRLEELLLNANEVGDLGATHLVSALPGLSRLRQLHLGGNAISAAGIQTIEEACARHGRMKVGNLNVSYQGIESEQDHPED